MPQGKRSVSEKSTKPEILAAYHELLAKEGEKPVIIKERDSALVNLDTVGGDATKQLAELKLGLSREIDKMSAELAQGTEAVRHVQLTANQERTRLVELHTEQQRQLDAEIVTVRRAWQREQAEIDRARREAEERQAVERSREEEAYQYQQSLTRRNELDESEREKAARERTLAEREQVLKERERAIQTMEKELEAVPAKLEAAVKAAEQALIARLANEHDRALREQAVISEHAQSLAQLTITNLEVATRRQSDELSELKRELAAAQDQLKQMAVAVIETNKPTETSKHTE